MSTTFIRERVLLGGVFLIPMLGYFLTISAVGGSWSMMEDDPVAVIEKNVPSGSFMKKVGPM